MHVRCKNMATFPNESRERDFSVVFLYKRRDFKISTENVINRFVILENKNLDFIL